MQSAQSGSDFTIILEKLEVYAAEDTEGEAHVTLEADSELEDIRALREFVSEAVGPTQVYFTLT